MNTGGFLPGAIDWKSARCSGVRKGSAGAPPDAPSRVALAEWFAPSTFNASGGAPLAAGGAPALSFS